MNRNKDQFKERDVILLDGGTGRELRARGITLSDNIWSASALVTAPRVV